MGDGDGAARGTYWAADYVIWEESRVMDRELIDTTGAD
jgi:hypothetical protein